MPILELPPLLLLLVFAPVLFSGWAIFHAGTHEFSSLQEKSLWIAAVVFLPLVGAIAYAFIGRSRCTGRTIFK